MLDRVVQTIKQHSMIERGDTVILSVSGGADSITLAHILWELHSRYDLKLHMFHLHHGLRGREADRDAAFVAQWAGVRGIPCTVRRVDVAALGTQGQGPEAVARAVRYQELGRLALAIGFKRIAVGHHRDDLAETVLLNLIRGTGTKGLAGIPPVRLLEREKPGGPVVIRPLIHATRTEIERYCAEQGIQYVQDETNHTDRYFRNEVRRELIPLLRRYNPRVVDHLAALADSFRAEDSFLDEAARQALLAHGGTLNREASLIPWKALDQEHQALRSRMIRLAGAALGAAFDHRTVERLGTLPNDGVSRYLTLKSSLIAMTAGQGIYISRRSPRETAPPTPVSVPGVTVVTPLGCRVRASIGSGVHPPDSRRAILLNTQRLPGTLAIRGRQPGDRIWPVGMGGSKKVQDILVDAKVPRWLRDRVPILVAGDQVLWVVGYRADRRFLASGEDSGLLVEVESLVGEIPEKP